MFSLRLQALLCSLLLLVVVPCWALKMARDDVVKPNILFLIADQHRFDALGQGAHTPNLDRLAKSGARFTKHYSSTPTCTPARAALLTGLSPWRHGLLSQGEIPAEYSVEFPRAMANHGYNTVLVGKGHYALHDHGFQNMTVYDAVRAEMDDYDTWFKSQPETEGQEQPNWDALNSWMPVTWPHSEYLHPTAWTGGMALKAIRKLAPQAQAGTPFLLKVSFHRPHSPYDPLERHLQLMESFDLRGRAPSRATDGWDEVFKSCQGGIDRVCGQVAQEDEDKMRLAYLASIAFVDEQVGRVLEEVYAQGLWDSTFVIYTSDHGDQQSDHFLFRKSYPFEGSVHIPLILHWPDSMSDRITMGRGSWVDKPTELRDIFPTFLDIAGLWSDWYEEQLDGRPLTWLLSGRESSWRPWIDLEHGAWLLPPWSALTDGQMKFIYWPRPGEMFCGADNIKAPGEFQLFDLRNDPQETVDLARDPARAEELELWKGRLVEQYRIEGRGDYWLSPEGQLIGRGSCRNSPNFPGAIPCTAGPGLALFARELLCARAGHNESHGTTPLL